LNGAAASLADYRGKPVLLHFWATWCGVCNAEQSSLDELSRDLPVLTVASQSGSASDVAAFVRERHVEPRVIADPSRELARRFGVTTYPTTFVIDAGGEIRHVEVGYTTELGLRARMWLAAL
jgi:thiol-disulfide isomerase/thioredoxin